MRSSFARRQIVWGLIEGYPWWPGRVISMHMQSQQLIYKVLFFADTTYAYLQGNHLRPFQADDEHKHSQQNDVQLAKAIRMAYQSYAKSQASKEQSLPSSTQQSFGMQSRKQSNIFDYEKERIVEQIIENGDYQGNHILDENQQKFDRIRSEETMANMHQGIEEGIERQTQEIVTVENIIEVLQRRMRIQRRFQYNYADRKNNVRQKMALKETLLERYSLHTLISVPKQQNCTNQTTQSHLINSKRKGIKRSKVNKDGMKVNIECLQGQCLKKLYKYSRRMSLGKINCNTLKKISYNSLKKVRQLSNNHLHLFKQIFVSLLRFIQRLDPSRIEQSTHLMSMINGYLDKMQAEQEEGSKMTQVCIPAPDFNIDH